MNSAVITNLNQKHLRIYGINVKNISHSQDQIMKK